MQKYGGQLIHHREGAWGPLEVVQQGPVRALHFGGSAKQSCVDMRRPAQLLLTYTQAMMSPLLFHQHPERILLIGLGGGALAHFLLHHFPGCEIHAVDNDADVIDIARRWFDLPEHPGLHCHVADGGDFLLRQAPPHAFDLILLDAYDDDGLAETVGGQPFFQACRNALRPGGVLSMNLWCSQGKRRQACEASLNAVFQQQVLQLPVRERGNIILLAFAGPAPKNQLKGLRRHAAEIEPRFRLPFPELLRDLRRNNTSIFARLFG